MRAHARVPPAPDAHRAVPPRAIRRRTPAPPRGRGRHPRARPVRASNPAQAEVLHSEPRLALDGGGRHGIEVIANLLREAPACLRESGFIGIETNGDEQSAMAERMMRADARYREVRRVPDLSGVMRFVTARRSAVR